MGIWEIIIGFVVLILSVIMIIVIILQEGHDAGLGTITGGADSFMKRGKAKTADAMFAKITKFCAITFFIFIVLLNALSYFGWTGKSDDKKIAETSSVVSEASTEGDKEESKTEESKADESKSEESKAESTEASKEESSKTEESSTAAAEASSTASDTSAAESSNAESSAA